MSSDHNFFEGAHGTDARGAQFNAAGRDINNTAAGRDINYTYYANPSINEEIYILAALKPVEREGHPRVCMEGTRKDILVEIDRWLNDFTAPNNILLITGSPGAGKSTIAATVVSSLDQRRRLGSSFAFKHDDTNLSDPSVVWRTVAADLARFHPRVKDHLVETLKGVDPGWKDISRQFQRLVETPLQKNQNELLQNPPVVVLDALDECGSDSSRSDQRRTLLISLTKWAGLPKAFKLVVTSRDERLPASFRQACQPIALETGSRVSQESSDDIQLFLKTRFAEIAEWFPSLGNWPGDSMIKELTRRAAGLFILAETLVRFVGHGDSLPNERLHLVLSGDFGEEADSIKGLYRRILDVSFKDPKAHILDGRKARILDAFRAIVGTVVLAKVPLHRDHLPHFLHPPVEGQLIDLVLNKLSSVISIGKSDKLIHLCHLSFADFLFDPTQSPEYSIDHALHSQNLTSACFQLMKAGLKFNICNLETSHLLNDEVADLPSRIQRSIPPSLSYACRFVAQHLKDTPHDGRDCSELLEDMRNFLHVRLLYWLEVMSFIKEVPVAPTALLMMAVWAETFNRDLTAFAVDAARFVVNFMTPITASAPHIYLSALPWSPRESKVAQHFLLDFPHTFSVFSGQNRRWPATINVLRGHTESISSVRFSPDGKRIVSGSYDKTIRIWDAVTGEAVVGPLEGHTGWITSVRFSPDGKRIVSSSNDKTIRIWDAVTGEAVVGPFEGHTYSVKSVVFSPNRKHVVSGLHDKTIRIWDAVTGEAVGGPLEGHTGWVTSIEFSPDGKCVVSGSNDKTIRIWDAVMGEAVVGPLEGHMGWVTSVGFSPDGKCVVSSSNDSTIWIWDAVTGEGVVGPIKGHTDCVMSVGFSPDGKRVVSGSYDSIIRIWDAVTGEAVVGPITGHTDWVRSVGFSPDGKRIVSGSYDKTIRIWDAVTGEAVVGPIEGHRMWVTSVGFSPDGKHVVSGSNDKTIRIWDAVTGEAVVGPLEGHTDWVTSVMFSPDGKCVVSGSYDKTIRIWNAVTGEAVVGPIKGHTDRVMSVGFSPDGKRVVSGSDDKTIRIWNAVTGEAVVAPIEGHTHYVTSVGFSPDGKRVVSGSYDSTTRIWDAVMGEAVVGPIEGHRMWVTSVGFSPDRKRVVSGLYNETIQNWHASHFGKFQNCHFDSRSGWMKADNRDGILFWVPLHCRGRVCGTDTMVIIGADMIRLDLSFFTHGLSWAQCRQANEDILRTTAGNSTAAPFYNHRTTALPALSSLKPFSQPILSRADDLDAKNRSSILMSTRKSLPSSSDSLRQDHRGPSPPKPIDRQPLLPSSSTPPTYRDPK